MSQLIKILLISICYGSAQAALQVRIDSSPVSIKQSFQLTLIQTDTQDSSVPDFSVLKNDFRILGTARQVSYSMVNGQSSSSSQWIVSLKPLKTGVLSIPAIRVGNEHSTPMTINVEQVNTVQNPTEPDNNDESQALMLKTEANETNPYVNQEIIYTVKLYNSKRLLDAQYQAPQVSDAIIIPLGEAKRYQTLHNNTNFIIEEQKYAIFPQKKWYPYCVISKFHSIGL